jgi:hypothetical protein
MSGKPASNVSPAPVVSTTSTDAGTHRLARTTMPPLSPNLMATMPPRAARLGRCFDIVMP